MAVSPTSRQAYWRRAWQPKAAALIASRSSWLTAWHRRAPTGRELQLALDFLGKETRRAGAEKARDEFALALFNLNAFLYVN